MALKVTDNTTSYPGHTLGEWRNYGAFAAIKFDGAVITWVGVDYGGDSSDVAAKLNGRNDVVQIFS